MSTYTDFYLHTGGEISVGASGFQYNVCGPNAVTRRMRVKNKPTLPELVHKIHVKLGLGLNDVISRIIYKSPMYNRGSLCWTSVDLADDEDIDAIYDNLMRYDDYNLVELIIEVGEGGAGASRPTYGQGYQYTSEALERENIEAGRQQMFNEVGPSQPTQSNQLRQSITRLDGELLGTQVNVSSGQAQLRRSVSQVPNAMVSQPRRSISRRVGDFFSKSLFGNRSRSNSSQRNFVGGVAAQPSHVTEPDNQRYSISHIPGASRRRSVSHVPDDRQRGSISHIPPDNQRHSVSQIPDLNQQHSVQQVTDITTSQHGQSFNRRDVDLLCDSIFGNTENISASEGTGYNANTTDCGQETSMSFGENDDLEDVPMYNDYVSPNDDVEAETVNMIAESDGDDSDHSEYASPLASMHPIEETGQENFVFPSEHYSEIDFDAAQIPICEDLHFATWDGVSELSTGLVFKSKDEVKYCVKKYSIMRNVDFRVVESKPTYWVVQCAMADDGCRWRLRAIRKESSPFWTVTRFKGPHSCVAGNVSMDHRQLGSQIIRKCITGMVSKQPTLPIDVIIEAVKQQFNVEVSYRKAWYAKMRAIECIFGNYVESYQRLPRFLIALQTYNPGTVYEFVVQETEDPSEKQFKRVFWSFKPALDGLAHCKPLLLIDGTFLTGKFKQTLLIASSVDGNSMLFPVAFAIVESENKSSWAWFMSMIRKHVTQRVGLTVVSDRHAGIMAVFRDERSGWKEPLAFHRFCLRHFVSNYNTHHRNPTIKNLLYKAGAHFQRRKFEQLMDNIKELDEESYNWAMKISPEYWTLSEDGGYRYGHLTTNIAESVNSALKGVRMMPITAIIEHVLARLVKFYNQRREMYMAKMAQGLRFTPRCVEVMTKRANKARQNVVMEYDIRYKVFKVLSCRAPDINVEPETYIVSLQKRECECGKFQGTKIPCSHAIACCMYRNLDMYHFVDNCYTIAESLKCYDGQFNPMGNKAYWPEYQGPKLVPDMELQRKKGRPKTTRIRNEMDRREKGYVTHCSKCGHAGHNKKTCNSDVGSSSQNFRG